MTLDTVNPYDPRLVEALASQEGITPGRARAILVVAARRYGSPHGNSALAAEADGYLRSTRGALQATAYGGQSYKLTRRGEAAVRLALTTITN